MNKDRQAEIIKAFSDISAPFVEGREVPSRAEEMVEAFGRIGEISRDAAANLERNARGMMAATNKTYGPPSKKRKDDNYRIRIR